MEKFKKFIQQILSAKALLQSFEVPEVLKNEEPNILSFPHFDEGTLVALRKSDSVLLVCAAK